MKRFIMAPCQLQIFCNLVMDKEQGYRIPLFSMATASHNEPFDDVCVRALREGGARITHARLAVIAALSTSSRPMTPKDVMREVRRASPRAPIDLVSIYRTLGKLTALQLVHEVSPGGGYLPCRHSACGNEAHVLLRCRNCSTILESDLGPETVRPLLRHLDRTHGFRVTGRAIQIEGVCEVCRGA